MKKSKYKELEQLNREMALPLEALKRHLKDLYEGVPMPIDIMRNMIVVHNNSLKIKQLLEEEEDVKTKYKDQKLF